MPITNESHNAGLDEALFLKIRRQSGANIFPQRNKWTKCNLAARENAASRARIQSL